jgi:hypothetical protein
MLDPTPSNKHPPRAISSAQLQRTRHEPADTDTHTARRDKPADAPVMQLPRAASELNAAAAAKAPLNANTAGAVVQQH